jgi:hypothetical protein
MEPGHDSPDAADSSRIERHHQFSQLMAASVQFFPLYDAAAL